MRLSHAKIRYFLIASAVCAVDQLIKAEVRRSPVHSTLFRVPGFFDVSHYANTGAAFSLLRGYTPLIAVLSIGLLIALVLLLRSMDLTWGAKTTLAVLIGGGMGNLMDRILRGEVTDYICLRFISFPVFNFADICITLCVFILAIYLLTGRLDTHPEETAHGSDH